MDNQLQMELSRKVALAKMRLLCANGFFGVLLMHMEFGLSDLFDTAATDGKTIVFCPGFLASLSDAETEFVLSHEVLHAALSHNTRREWREPTLWNIACDLVVNATYMKEHGNDPASITVNGNVMMHLLPDGTPGCDYSAEEVYEKLLQAAKEGSAFFETACTVDDHSGWRDTADDQQGKTLEAEWETRVVEAAKTVAAFQGAGKLPGCAERIIEKYERSPRLDWRRILNDFLAPDEFDYSFQQPDSRYSEDIFLPGFRPEEESSPRNILFLIDTSGSISDETLRELVTEVDCAVKQFPAFTGELAFFDTKVYSSVKISDETDLDDIKPQGGGGTSFRCIFEYVKKLPSPPARLVILTDGLAPFPKESAACGIPTCWVLTNKKIIPPWGEYCWL